MDLVSTYTRANTVDTINDCFYLLFFCKFQTFLVGWMTVNIEISADGIKNKKKNQVSRFKAANGFNYFIPSQTATPAPDRFRRIHCTVFQWLVFGS